MFQPVQPNNLHFRRNWVGFFLLGLSNLLPYAMVSAAANSIVRSFYEKAFVATVYGLLGSLTFVKLLNTFVLHRASYNTRFAINSLVLLLGVVGMALAPNFITTIVAVIVIGGSYAFGENLALGYLSKFDSRLVNAWASGGGCAGVIGAATVIIFGCVIKPTTDKAHDHRVIDRNSLLACCPFVFIYLVAYLVVIVEPSQESGLVPVEDVDEDQSIHHTEQDALPGSEQRLSQGEPRRPTMADIFRGFKLIWKLGANLALAFFATYVCRVASAKAEDDTEYDKNCPELYPSLQLCLQAAQFASLSSVQLIKIRKVHILMAIQLMNAVIWLVNTKYKFMPVYILPVYMEVIGLIMGAIYVNTFYMIYKDDIYPKEHKDLLVNMTAIFLIVGVSSSSILMTALYKTALAFY